MGYASFMDLYGVYFWRIFRAHPAMTFASRIRTVLEENERLQGQKTVAATWCVCVCVLRNENGVRGFLMYGTTWWNRSAKRCLSFLIIVCSHLPHGYSGQSFCQWPSRRSLQTPMGSSLFSTRFHPSILFWCHREMKNMLVDYMNYWHLFISSWGRSTPIGSLSWEMVINFPRRYDPQALQRNSAPAGGDFPADVNCWDGKMQKRNQQVMFGWVN